jgi:hypothetical protein
MVKKLNKEQKDFWNSFSTLTTIVSTLVFSLIIIENIVLFIPENRVLKIAISIFFLVLISVFAFKARKNLVKMFSSMRFAIVNLFFILICSIIGTVILQKEKPENYIEYYGSSVYNLLNILKVTDIFHSYQFRALLVLLSLNIIFCVFKRNPFTKMQIGFFLTHIGIIIIIIGSSISSFFQFKGYINFLKDQTFNEIQIQKDNVITDEKFPLGFSIKLADFKVDMYETKYKLYLYEKGDDSFNYKVVSSFEPKAGTKIKIPYDDSVVIVKSAITDTASCPAGKHTIIVKSPDSNNEKQICIGLGEIVDVPDYQYSIELLKYLPHFNYDITTKSYISLTDKPENPAIQLKVQNKNKPEDVQQTWLFSKIPDFGSMHGKNSFPFELVFKFQTSSPALKLEIITKAEHREQVMVADDKEPIFFKNDRYLLSYHKQPEEVKDYKSTLEIIEEGKTIKSQIVEVNKPLAYKGFYFYQSNYNPENPNYSGIQVVKDQGVFIVYAGFLVLISGLIYIFYIKPLFKRDSVREE